MPEATAPALRVAMISYYLPSGSKIGVGYQVHALANALVQRGHRVTVFSGCAASDGAMYATVTVPLKGHNRTFKFALALRRVDFSQFDVLHAHGDDYWLWRRRVLHHVRTFHGSCFAEALRIRGIRERLRMFLLGLTEVLASIVADRTVAVSANTRRWMPWVKTVIPNGVDTSRFSSGRKTGHPTILFVGTYERRKRGRLLAEAFERDVLDQIPGAELLMVCEDAPERRGIQVLGRVSDEHLADLYAGAWLFCLPSTYEGFGIPYVEAMAAGCAVVATPNPGAIEVTAGGTAGLIVGDDELGITLRRLLLDGAERRRLGSAGVSRARQYDLANVVSAYEALYGQRCS